MVTRYGYDGKGQRSGGGREVKSFVLWGGNKVRGVRFPWGYECYEESTNEVVDEKLSSAYGGVINNIHN